MTEKMLLDLQRLTKFYSSQLRDFTLKHPGCAAINPPTKLQTATQGPTGPGASGWRGDRWGTSLSDPGPTGLGVAGRPDQMEMKTPPGHPHFWSPDLFKERRKTTGT